MGNLWITSDFHFCHDKPFIYGERGFNSVKEMNETLVSNFNSIVKKNDIVYILGDVMLSDLDTGIKYLKQLNGIISIVKGNHDSGGKLTRYSLCSNVHEVSNTGLILKYGKRDLLFTHFPTLVNNYDEKPFSRTINFCGHSHTKDEFLHHKNGCYHVELEAHNNYPVNLEEAMSKIIKKEREEEIEWKTMDEKNFCII